MTEPKVEPAEQASIARLASDFGVDVEADAVARLGRFVALFAHWNRSINLASVRSDHELVSRHLIDAFALATLAGSAVVSAVDVGSGGGLPAIPLAVLMPATPFTLFEPNRKKVAFLRTAIRELGLGGRVKVEAASVEHPVPVALKGAFDLSLSRATLAPASWLELGLSLVSPRGRVAVFAAGDSGAGLPPAEAARDYGEGRHLLLFRRRD